jgi:hypothetical protein
MANYYETFFTDGGVRPKKVLDYPSDYRGEEAICLCCTQLPDPKEQKIRVKAWAEALPGLKELRRIRFATRFPEALLAPLSRCTSLEEVNIKWSGLRSIAPLRKLQNLTALHIGSSPSIADLPVLAELKGLRLLSLENIRAARDLSWLAGMPQLEQLAIDGSEWSTQKVDSLAPLGSLPRLERLNTFNTQVTDKESLHVLEGMPILRIYETGWLWPKGMLRGLAQARPDLWVNGQRWPDWQDFEERMASK